MAVAPCAFRLAPGMVVTPLVLLCRASLFLAGLIVLKHDESRWNLVGSV
jgi:hypothetical protein